MNLARVRAIPQRTCLGCRKVRAKRELIRLVLTPGDGVTVDLTGKRAGRGAYLCPDPGCWREALKVKVLEKALRTRLTPEALAPLWEFASTLGRAK